MFNYVSSLENYSEEMIDIFLEIYDEIKEKFQYINKNAEILVVDNTLDNLELVLDSLNKLADVLEMNPLFEEEFFLLLSIISDIEYIVLDNKHLLKDNIVYIENIVINFCKLISDKQDMLLSNKIIDYKNEFEEFMNFFNSEQEIFYYNLPEINEDFNDAIVKVANMLC